jgi:hypothetical protein
MAETIMFFSIELVTAGLDAGLVVTGLDTALSRVWKSLFLITPTAGEDTALEVGVAGLGVVAGPTS